MTRRPSRHVSAPDAEPRPMGPRRPEPRHGATRGASRGSLRPGSKHGAEIDVSEEPAALLSRLGDLLTEAAGICRELATRTQLDAGRRSSLMGGMGELGDPSDQKRFLSVRDMATKIGVTEKTVRRWRDAGKLPPGIVLGGVVRWRPEVVQEWLAEREESR